jgi:uncharacterized secreted protein with C-terminal beta-propeller domain
MKTMISTIFSLSLIVSILIAAFIINSSNSNGGLRSFKSLQEMEEFVKSKFFEKYLEYYFGEGYWLEGPRLLLNTPEALEAGSIAGAEYSTTNIQVLGVDEADIVKTDGKYIYVISESELFIVEAYPLEEIKKISSIKVEGTPIGLFINDDRLALLKQSFAAWETGSPKEYPDFYRWVTVLEIYDVSNREDPVLRGRVSIEGAYLSSRMIDRYVYIVTTSPVVRIIEEELKVLTPRITVDNDIFDAPPYKIFYSDKIEFPESYTNIVAVDLYSEERLEYKSVLTGYASCIYVSVNNIYVVMPEYSWLRNGAESTEIHRIRIDGLEIRCEASGSVPGRVLNQFSMDEYEGYFRIATTTGHVARFLSEATSANHVYVLDSEKLQIVGRLEGLAPGEEIYSARFMGSKCYLVTFKKVDPLFTIDLSNPEEPRVLGKLKIPGYSDYLHPYDDNFLIGVGKETVEAEEGDFAWYQGLKISLFDVSNVSSPREVGKIIIGDRGTDSPVLRDHHAFLFDRKRSLLVIPILEAKIFREKYPEGVPPYAYGEYVFQGAYVFKISPEEGIILRGRITHLEDTGDLEKSGYYFSSKYQVERSLYIGDVLYTVSKGKIKANSLTDLSEISEVKLD